MVYKICITSNSGTPENLPSKFRRFSQNAETLLVRVYFGPEFRGPEFGVSLYVAFSGKGGIQQLHNRICRKVSMLIIYAQYIRIYSM